jgi:O-glycosyl hydrolase
LTHKMKVNRMDALEMVELTVRADEMYQTIDGFGMNINPIYWENGGLEPIMGLFHQDLEAGLYRLDVYGESNWIDPESKHDNQILNDEVYKKVYTSAPFQDAWAMARYLNSKGIKPYLNASGIVPKWMCEADGVTLKDYEAFSEMMASMLYWARHEEKIMFELFGPLNETDLGPPEGPFVSGVEYVKCMEVLVNVLDRWGLSDVKLVVAEQAHFDLDYVAPLLNSRKLVGRLGVIGMHDYSSNAVISVADALHRYEDKSTRFWMTEYGDLDVSGEKEWYVAWISIRRLISYLQQGAQAALVWDAYDNYHDHDKAWSLYGLVRRGRHEYTPKKRYFATKQVYKFVKSGSRRIAADTKSTSIHAAGFLHDDHGMTIIGMNESEMPITLQVNGVTGGSFQVYITSETLNCMKMGLMAAEAGNLTVLIPAKTIFTLSQSHISNY